LPDWQAAREEAAHPYLARGVAQNYKFVSVEKCGCQLKSSYQIFKHYKHECGRHDWAQLEHEQPVQLDHPLEEVPAGDGCPVKPGRLLEAGGVAIKVGWVCLP